MSDVLGHECGLAMVRLLQPLTHYRQRYGDAAWGLRRLYLLMEKQHNRGQDGAGMAMVKFDMPGGETYLRRVRSDDHNALEHVFDTVMRDVRHPRLGPEAGAEGDDLQLKRRHRYLGEVYLGHLRYGTYSGNAKCNCHPLVRTNNTASRNLAIAGNFNMTNSQELFRQLIEYGLNPVGESDTQVILERIGYFLDREHDYLHATIGPESFRGLDGRDLATEISRELNLVRILGKASKDWDGGYVFAGLLGNGDAFVCRDPAGIRPGFFYKDDEVIAAASERAALASVFDVDPSRIEPIGPGCVLAIKRSGEVLHERFTDLLPLRQCTFERIYFSRGNDPQIYRERKALGRNLAPRVLKALEAPGRAPQRSKPRALDEALVNAGHRSVRNDRLAGAPSRSSPAPSGIEHAVFSFIPNTAEAAYMGMLEEIEHLTRARQADELWQRIQSGSVSKDDLEPLLNGRIRAEKIAHKDQRLRTFITHDAARRDLVMHIYDITRGVVKSDDSLVVLDDSIVRGTTLRESIITILSRLNPRRIIIVSSAPPIMYPDCYGIDMSQLGRFIAFEAAVTLLRDRGEEALLDEVHDRCSAQADWPAQRMQNHVRRIYERFSLDELSAKVAELVRPPDIAWSGGIDVIYQSVDGLRAAMPEHTGDWYFTGDYPTPGGYRVLNQSYLNWRAKADVRAY